MTPRLTKEKTTLPLVLFSVLVSYQLCEPQVVQKEISLLSMRYHGNGINEFVTLVREGSLLHSLTSFEKSSHKLNIIMAVAFSQQPLRWDGASEP
jgi:hypothetical protein